jgi:hypothetical protein
MDSSWRCLRGAGRQGAHMVVPAQESGARAADLQCPAHAHGPTLACGKCVARHTRGRTQGAQQHEQARIRCGRPSHKCSNAMYSSARFLHRLHAFALDKWRRPPSCSWCPGTRSPRRAHGGAGARSRERFNRVVGFRISGWSSDGSLPVLYIRVSGYREPDILKPATRLKRTRGRSSAPMMCSSVIWSRSTRDSSATCAHDPRVQSGALATGKACVLGLPGRQRALS